MGQKLRVGLVLCATASLQTSLMTMVPPPITMLEIPLPSINSEIRVAHAKELYGDSYRGSVVRRAEYTEGVEDFILTRTYSDLPGPWKNHAQLIARTIIEKANENQMDPLFLLALIKRESQLNPLARGRHGEIGLMQLKPDTAAWIAQKSNLQWQGPEQLEDPTRNIELGVAYLSMLRKRYNNHSLYYISAYNMGPRKMQQLLEQDLAPRIYASNVMGIYTVLYRDLIRSSLLKMQNSSQIRVASND